MNSPRTTHFETGVASTALAPQLFFEDATLWETAPKLMRLIESAKALGIVLAYELVHLAHGA